MTIKIEKIVHVGDDITISHPPPRAPRVGPDPHLDPAWLRATGHGPDPSPRGDDPPKENT